MAFAADVRPRVKILVLGDAAVGKSALCALLAHAVQVADGASYSATVGVEPEVLVHKFRGQGGPGMPADRLYFVELWDIGGARRFSPARPVLYPGTNGVMMVFDASNQRSYKNLRTWVAEVAAADRSCREGIEEPVAYLGGAGGAAASEIGGDGWSGGATALGDLPVVCVRTKVDMATAGKARPDTAADFGLDCIDCSAATGVIDRDQVLGFFDKVIQRRFDREAGVADIARLTSEGGAPLPRPGGAVVAPGRSTGSTRLVAPAVQPTRVVASQ